MARAALRCAALIAGVLAGTSGALAQTQPPLEMPHGEMRWAPTLYVLLDQLEYAPGSPERLVSLDGLAWYGGARNRLWLRAQGETATTEASGDAEAQLLLGRLIDPFWDMVIGARYDHAWGEDEARELRLAIGFIGLAPYRFELEPTVFVSHRGEIAARLEAAYVLLFTQRFMAEPEFELNASLQDIPSLNLESGINSYEAGLRFRYEIVREFAPYVGVSRSWRAHVAGLPTDADRDQTHFVAGFRLWR